MPKIYLYGGSFYPPGVHHEAVARIIVSILSPEDRFIVIPCGPREDKMIVNDLSVNHRAALCDLAFKNIPHVEIDLTDLELSSFSRAWDLQQHYQERFPDHEICHVIGADLIAGGARGESEIQKKWFRGIEVWNTLHFVVQRREDVEWTEADLPPNAIVVDPSLSGSSTEIRDRIFKHQPFAHLVSEPVCTYIDRHGLFTGRVMPSPIIAHERFHPFVVADENNDNAREFGERLTNLFRVSYGEHTHILVIGGDGFMLHTIRRLWRDHVPFLGLNLGTRGFLLNSFDPETIAERLRDCHELKIYTEPLLFVESETVTGEKSSMLAFNDAWVDRLTGQTIWTKVFMNDEVKFDPIMSDVMIVSTAAGSTGYAYRMGGARLIPGTRMLQLAGSCVCSHHWKNEPLPIDTRIRFEAVNQKKRPMRGFCDGVPLGELNSMSIRVSETATAQLAFFPETNLQRRISEL